MKPRLLAFAAFLSAAGAGTVVFLNWSSGVIDDNLPDSFGRFEPVDRRQCSSTNCNAAQCNNALAVLQDAGSPCTLRFIECPMRMGAVAHVQADDAGAGFDGGLYQQVRFVAMRCPAVDGGFALGIPTDDAGWPMFAVNPGTPGCKKRPIGTALALCSRLDGGDQGALNQAPASELVGAACVAVPCGVIAGDDPEGGQ